ncbi:MAG: hypothetical protein IJW00_09575 [Clostridia bacterium]|nr:hypothetical protein [Clostridia bacterium]
MASRDRRMMDPKQQKKEIKRLTRALSQKDRALQRAERENAALKRRLAEAKGSYGHAPEALYSKKKKASSDEEFSEQKELFRMGAVNARRFSRKSYLSYLIQSIKESVVGMVFRRLTRFLRRLRLVRTISVVVAAVMATLLLSAVFVTVLPFLFFIGITCIAAATLRARAANRLMREKLSGKRVRVFILPDAVTFRDDTFAERSAKAMAREPDAAILVVSPRLISSRGLGGRGMYFTVREEARDLYLVRRGYYFILRRRVLDTVCGEVTFVY